MRTMNRASAAALCVVVVIVCTGGLAATQSSHEAAWLNGAWEGTQHGKFLVPCKLHLTYNPETLPSSLSGTGKFHFAERQVIADAKIEGSLKNDKVILKVYYSRGGPLNNRSITFSLTRQKDGSLYGHGLNPRGRSVELTLKKVE